MKSLQLLLCAESGDPVTDGPGRRRSRCPLVHGRAELDCERPVGAHSHRQLAKSVARGDDPEQREMGRRLFAFRRNRHQPLDRQTVGAAAEREKGVGVLRQDARLLRLGPGIDLDEQARMFSEPLDLVRRAQPRSSPDRWSGSRRNSRPPPAPCCFAAGRSGGVRSSGRCAAARARRSRHFGTASCTRFSPNRSARRARRSARPRRRRRSWRPRRASPLRSHGRSRARAGRSPRAAPRAGPSRPTGHRDERDRSRLAPSIPCDADCQKSGPRTT